MAPSSPFDSGKFADAISEYTQAIRLDPSGHVYYSNRAMTYLKARSYQRCRFTGNLSRRSPSGGMHAARQRTAAAAPWSGPSRRTAAATPLLPPPLRPATLATATARR